MDLLPGVSSHVTSTDRLRVHWLQAGPPDGEPVLMVHGNLSTSRFFEHLLPGAPARYRLVVPDMRGFGRTEPRALDVSRGLRDWADDLRSLVTALSIERPVHLVGWSTAGAAISHYAMEHRGVASLTYIDPVSPYGYGGVRLSGTPCFPDHAGSGAGGVAPEFVTRLRQRDTGAESPFSPRNVMNGSYWSLAHREPRHREDILVAEILESVIGDAGYPGDSTASPNWPGFAPGRSGILNALSPKYCNWSEIVDLDPKPPVLWTHGSQDVVIADEFGWEVGTLGAAGVIPGWPGPAVYPPQPMVTQIRNVLSAYRNAGGRVQMEIFEGSGHAPHVDAAARWSATFFAFLDSVR